MWAKIITIKRTKDLNYFSLFVLNLFNTRVSQFELNYWNKWTFPWHTIFLRCTCIFLFYGASHLVIIHVKTSSVNMPHFVLNRERKKVIMFENDMRVTWWWTISLTEHVLELSETHISRCVTAPSSGCYTSTVCVHHGCNLIIRVSLK